MKGLLDELLGAAQAREGSTGAKRLRLWWVGVSWGGSSFPQTPPT